MEDHAPHLDALLRLEAQHEDLLQRLDELDKEVATVLKEWRPADQPLVQPQTPAD